MTTKKKRKLLSKSMDLGSINKENAKLEKKLALLKESQEITEEQDLPNSNITLVSFATDANGNRVIRVKNNTNDNKFKIATKGLPKTHELSIKELEVDELTPEQIADVSKEVIDFVSNYGTDDQKTGLVSEEVVKEGYGERVDLSSEPRWVEHIDREIDEYVKLLETETDPEMIDLIKQGIVDMEKWKEQGFIPAGDAYGEKYAEESDEAIKEATKLDEPTKTVFTVQGNDIVRINQFSEEEGEENMVFLSFDSIKKMAEEIIA